MSNRSIFGLEPDQLNQLLSLGTDIEGAAKESEQDADTRQGRKAGREVASTEEPSPEDARALERQATASLGGAERPGGPIQAASRPG
jgi:hypothetical protein